MPLKQYLKWIVTADTNACVIYAYEPVAEELVFVKRINHPENKLKDIDITADKAGHYGTSSISRGAYSQQTDPKENLINHFALEIAKELEHGRNTQAYLSLVLVALPHMNGLIKHHLNKHVKEMITRNIEKNWMEMTTTDILSALSTRAAPNINGFDARL